MDLMQLLRNNTCNVSIMKAAKPGTVVINHFSRWSKWFFIFPLLLWINVQNEPKIANKIGTHSIVIIMLFAFFSAAFGPNINYHGKLHVKLDILRCAPLDRINYLKLFALITIFITLLCEQRKNVVINRQPMRFLFFYFSVLCLRSFSRQNENE